MTIGMACNFYREPNAIHGLIEESSKFFDDMVFISAPPEGAKPDDETISILEKWDCRIVHTKINDGFGAARNLCVKSSKADWVMVLDADERFFHTTPIFIPHGTESFPGTKNPDVKATIEVPAFNQGEYLRQLIRERTTNEFGAIKMMRRHWFDFTMKRPTQNWKLIPDWQFRLINRHSTSGFDTKVKMHERCIDLASDSEPMHTSGNEFHGPFFDHFWCVFKPMEPEQRKEDIEIYDMLHSGVSKDMWAGQAP